MTWSPSASVLLWWISCGTRRRRSAIWGPTSSPTIGRSATSANGRALGAAAVGEVLLDQRVTAGIGNVYRCEALWHTRINPWTKTNDLDDARLTALFETA